MFEQYETELSEILRDVKQKLSMATSYTDDAKAKLAAVEEIGGLMTQAGDLTKQLDVEVRSADPNSKRMLQGRQQPLKDMYKSLQQQFHAAQEEAQRSAVLGTGTKDASASSRGRLVDANTRASRQNDVIRGALEVAHDTEQVALDITGELQRNRETIQNIRGHISDTSGSLGTARGLINSMQKREVQQKVILSFVAAVLIGAIGTVSYYTFN